MLVERSLPQRPESGGRNPRMYESAAPTGGAHPTSEGTAKSAAAQGKCCLSLRTSVAVDDLPPIGERRNILLGDLDCGGPVTQVPNQTRAPSATMRCRLRLPLSARRFVGAAAGLPRSCRRRSVLARLLSSRHRHRPFTATASGARGYRPQRDDEQPGNDVGMQQIVDCEPTPAEHPRPRQP
jgi:hypothetical protein